MLMEIQPSLQLEVVERQHERHGDERDGQGFDVWVADHFAHGLDQALAAEQAALPQLAVILRNVLNNNDRSGLYKAMFSLISINVKLIP